MAWLFSNAMDPTSPKLLMRNHNGKLSTCLESDSPVVIPARLSRYLQRYQISLRLNECCFCLFSFHLHLFIQATEASGQNQALPGHTRLKVIMCRLSCVLHSSVRSYPHTEKSIKFLCASRKFMCSCSDFRSFFNVSRLCNF